VWAATEKLPALLLLQVEGWVPFYLAFTAVMLSWTSLLAFTMRLYTIAGATAQWWVARGPGLLRGPGGGGGGGAKCPPPRCKTR